MRELVKDCGPPAPWRGWLRRVEGGQAWEPIASAGSKAEAERLLLERTGDEPGC